MGTRRRCGRKRALNEMSRPLQEHGESRCSTSSTRPPRRAARRERATALTTESAQPRSRQEKRERCPVQGSESPASVGSAARCDVGGRARAARDQGPAPFVVVHRCVARSALTAGRSSGVGSSSAFIASAIVAFVGCRRPHYREANAQLSHTPAAPPRIGRTSAPSASSRQRRRASFLRSRAHVVPMHRMQRLRPSRTSAGRPSR